MKMLKMPKIWTKKAIEKTLIGVLFSALCAVPLLAATPEVKMAAGPLFSGLANVHPNLLLSLSVEFPTVGVAYRGNGGMYNKTDEYAGYFNPKKCYAYSGSNRNPKEDDPALYFYIHHDADSVSHECNGKSFSGNFMNWVSSSAIDMLRYALTGGDRVIDKPEETVLQRAVLSDSEVSNFYANAGNFPRRMITASARSSAPNRVTPFNVSKLYVVSCRNRILFSDEMSGSLSNAAASAYCKARWDGVGATPASARDKKLGEYLVRVKVCDPEEGPVRKDLCQKFGSHYKPVGEIQRNADRMRVGVMGYLLDDSAQRYGGVLRAPIKYVGPTKITPGDFIESANERREWDPETGVFYNNPEDPAAPNGATNSGVVNYLNKFGRSGRYKALDPVGELYYEGIRYFQGKGPTPDATIDMTEAMKDGFPVIEEWTDPVVASCQKNYIVSIADVNTHWDRYIPGNARTTYGNDYDAHDRARSAESVVLGKTPALDVRKWTKLVGDMEVDASGAYMNPATTSGLDNLSRRDTGAGGHGTYYMAGLAYWANTHDVRLDKPTRVKTFAIDVDEYGNGLIDDNPRGIEPRKSQLYLAAKYGGFDAKTKDNNPFITLSESGEAVGGSYAEWSNGTDATAIPSNYFLASRPKEMIQSIRKIFAEIGGESGTISGVSTSTARLSTDGAYVYQPGFDANKWRGSLKKLKLALGDNGKVLIAAKPEWDAGAILTGDSHAPAAPAPVDRKIYTAVFDAAKAMSTVEFRWPMLGDEQKALLDHSPVDGSEDGLGEQRLAFLRGERDLETDKTNGMFRLRSGVLGDIINSNPVYVGAPSLSVRGSDYQGFYEARKNRTKAVYVGANDGMLHAFDAADGRELFAYVPHAIFPGLGRLADPRYRHQPYVDGAISVAEAQLGGSWKTVLAAGMGGGAQGVFALDVTDPLDFAGGGGALFEFTDLDDPDMGNVTGRPVIAKFRTGTADGAPVYKYYVVVASGLNNYKADGENRFNTDAAGALFLLSLDKQPSEQWRQGENYFKFRTPAADDTQENGLSTPALALAADGAVRYAYAGDLQGNLWRFDFSGDKPWSGALGEANPLFVAKDATGMRQPITVQPRVVFAPGGGYLVLFGTGKFLEGQDASIGNFATQSFYGIRDTLIPGYSIDGRAALTPRSLSKSDGNVFHISGDAISYVENEHAGQGWYFDFAASTQTGERSVTNPLVMDGLLFFNTLIPGSDPCATGGGRSYVLSAVTGLAANGGVTGTLSSVGMLSAPVTLETGSDSSERNPIGRRVVTRRRTVVNFGTEGASTGETVSSVLPAGRFSWREILNWQELRNAVTKE